eukprot:2081828-Prymnesium_polylepis.2
MSDLPRKPPCDARPRRRGFSRRACLWRVAKQAERGRWRVGRAELALRAHDSRVLSLTVARVTPI